MKRHTDSGLTLMEAVFVLATTLVLGAISIPVFKYAMYNYDETATVSAVSGAISSTRFQAVMLGYPFEVTLTPSTLSYQLLSEPVGSTVFTVVNPGAGSSTYPLPSAGSVSLKGLTGCTNMPTNLTGCSVVSGTTITYTFFSNGTTTSTPAGTGNSPLVYLQVKNTISCTVMTITGVGNVQTTAEAVKNCL